MKHFVIFLLAAGGLSARDAPTIVIPSAPLNEALRLALDNLYQSNVQASRLALSEYSAAHQQDPLPYSMRAATYLFGELERASELNENLLSEETNLRKEIHVDRGWAREFDGAIKLARRYARVRLLAAPRDRNALLAMCIVTGLQRDYLALVEHKLRESYSFIRESNVYAKRLLTADPTAYDAYFAKGFSEYLAADLPFYLRWMMSFDQVAGTREQGLNDLQVAAQKGQYLKPFAQLLLAWSYQREKRDDKTEELLAELTAQYPANQAFRSEYEKVHAKRAGHRNLE